ncbi:hypothetical protein B4135_2048 [Caldibacillus debilis]|uniref:Uncharacterized protein n=1 Tax=Caldibacillus debilis TaxID=301148 RepID=A0A150M3Y8_9BACI|nr:hypothetical protein B4135_2048 [Caldibacillus debilis]
MPGAGSLQGAPGEGTPASRPPVFSAGRNPGAPFARFGSRHLCSREWKGGSLPFRERYGKSGFVPPEGYREIYCGFGDMAAFWPVNGKADSGPDFEG